MKKISLLVSVITLSMITSTVFAEETSGKRVSNTHSYTNPEVALNLNKPEKESRTSAKKSGITELSSPKNKKTDTMPALKLTGSRKESGPTNPQAKHHLGCDCSDPDYILANASVLLDDDYDHDGFYPWLKVRFDINKYGHGQWVFARLYMSYEGGPWNHYATTDDFYISGFTSLDDHIVETELIEGFPSGYYDIKIELYHAGSEGWLTSFGPGDDSSLTALPLEDEYRDSDYYSYNYGYHNDYIEVSGGGSMGLISLILALIILLIRLYPAQKHNKRLP